MIVHGGIYPSKKINILVSVTAGVFGWGMTPLNPGRKSF